jgi:hypothetical protein
MPQKPLDRRRAEWKSSERIRFVKVKSTPYLMVEFNLSKWNFRFQSTFYAHFSAVLLSFSSPVSEKTKQGGSCGKEHSFSGRIRCFHL